MSAFQGFQLSVVKPNPTESFWQITKHTDNLVDKSKLEVNTCTRREGRENARERITIYFI